jgi:hypothetical protein
MLWKRRMDAGNRRQYPRFPTQGLEGRLKVNGRAQVTRVENLSLGGALVTGSCAPGKNVLLELRNDRGRFLRLVCRVIELVPKGRSRSECGLRVRFNPASACATAELYAMIRRLGGPPAPCGDAVQAELEPAFDIDVVEPVEVVDLEDFIDDDDGILITVADLMTELRIGTLERQLALVRRNARWRVH